MTRPAQRDFLSLGYTRILAPKPDQRTARRSQPAEDFVLPGLHGRSCSTLGIIPLTTVFPNVNIPGADELLGGTNVGEPQGRGDTTYQYSDTVGWIRGKHSLRMGVEFRRFANNNLNSGTGGMLTVGTLAAFLAGTPTQATQTSLPATPAPRVNALGAFVQDDDMESLGQC